MLGLLAFFASSEIFKTAMRIPDALFIRDKMPRVVRDRLSMLACCSIAAGQSHNQLQQASLTLQKRRAWEEDEDIEHRAEREHAASIFVGEPTTNAGRYQRKRQSRKPFLIGLLGLIPHMQGIARALSESESAITQRWVEAAKNQELATLFVGRFAGILEQLDRVQRNDEETELALRQENESQERAVVDYIVDFFVWSAEQLFGLIPAYRLRQWLRPLRYLRRSTFRLWVNQQVSILELGQRTGQFAELLNAPNPHDYLTRAAEEKSLHLSRIKRGGAVLRLSIDETFGHNTCALAFDRSKPEMGEHVLDLEDSGAKAILKSVYNFIFGEGEIDA